MSPVTNTPASVNNTDADNFLNQTQADADSVSHGTASEGAPPVDNAHVEPGAEKFGLPQHDPALSERIEAQQAADAKLAASLQPSVNEDLIAAQKLAQAHARDSAITMTKQFRVDLDNVLQALKSQPKSRERALSITKLQEAIMWLGMDLKELGAGNPYPNSYNPSNTVVDPTNGVKL